MNISDKKLIVTIYVILHYQNLKKDIRISRLILLLFTELGGSEGF